MSDSSTARSTARQASQSFSISRSSLKLMSIESVMPSNHLILCHPLLFLPSISPSIRVISNELTHHIRWPKYWSFSFSSSPSDEYSGLISLGLTALVSSVWFYIFTFCDCHPSVTLDLCTHPCVVALQETQQCWGGAWPAPRSLMAPGPHQYGNRVPDRQGPRVSDVRLWHRSQVWRQLPCVHIQGRYDTNHLLPRCCRGRWPFRGFMDRGMGGKRVYVLNT